MKFCNHLFLPLIAIMIPKCPLLCFSPSPRFWWYSDHLCLTKWEDRTFVKALLLLIGVMVA